MLGAWQHRDQFEEGLLEGAAAGEVDEEVDGGVEHEGKVVETCEAEDPQWRRFRLIVTAISNNVELKGTFNLNLKITLKYPHYRGTHGS